MRWLYIALLVSLTAVAADRPTDLKGWAKTTWGMTDEEILATLPGEATRLTGSIEARSYNGRFAAIGIERFDIGRDVFLVHFLKDKDGKLDRVYLKPIVKNPYEMSFKALESLLIEKYGQPNISDKTNEAGYKRTSRWIFPSTTIELTYWDVKALQMRLLSLIYDRNTGKDLSKI